MYGFGFMKDAEIFFDKNSEFYDMRLSETEYYFLNFIQNNEFSKVHGNNNLLDIGGGSGKFAKLFLENFPNIEVTVLDPSRSLLNRIGNPKIHKIQGKLPHNIPINSKFDYIHIKEVLHHITGPTIHDSKNLIKQSLKNIKNLLNDQGFLLIHELFYDGYLIPELPSYLIFNLLNLQNKLGFNVPIKEFILDLEVFFYTKNELESIINDSGFQIIDSNCVNFSNTLKKKLLFLKNWGRILIIAKNKD